MSDFKALTIAAKGLEACSKKSCKDFDALKSKVRSEYQEKLKKNRGLISKNFSEWERQKKVLEDDMHKKLQNAYACIVNNCEKEMRSLIKVDIANKESMIRSLERTPVVIDPKETAEIRLKRKQMIQKIIKKTKKEISDQNMILKSKTIDIKKVQKDLKHF
jgi:Zn-dependent M28 family amino/carboxypeptidase